MAPQTPARTRVHNLDCHTQPKNPQAPRLLDTLTQHIPPLRAHNPGNSSDFRLICVLCALAGDGGSYSCSIASTTDTSISPPSPPMTAAVPAAAAPATADPVAAALAAAVSSHCQSRCRQLCQTASSRARGALMGTSGRTSMPGQVPTDAASLAACAACVCRSRSTAADSARIAV